jgi:hypothetical protein
MRPPVNGTGWYQRFFSPNYRKKLGNNARYSLARSTGEGTHKVKMFPDDMPFRGSLLLTEHNVAKSRDY